jgi:hypothetical protein
MRSIFFSAVCLAFLLGSTGQVQAQSLYEKLFGNCVPNCIAASQCDDYCSKGLPYARPLCDGQCDDYGPKQLPCTRPTCATRCDDYCAKPIPQVCCPRPCSCASKQIGDLPFGKVQIGTPNSGITARQESVAEIAAKPKRFVLPQPNQSARKPKSESKSGEIDYLR